MKRRLLSVFVALCMALTMAPAALPAAAFANDDAITIVAGAEFDRPNDIFSGAVTNSGTIKGGTFTGPVTNNGTISGGTFYNKVTGSGAISGGTFYGDMSGVPTNQIQDSAKVRVTVSYLQDGTPHEETYSVLRGQTLESSGYQLPSTANPTLPSYLDPSVWYIDGWVSNSDDGTELNNSFNGTNSVLKTIQVTPNYVAREALTAPFTLEVQQLGNTVPPARTFELEVLDKDRQSRFSAADGPKVIAYVHTNGVGSYNAALSIAGTATQLYQLEGSWFFVRQKNVPEDGWTLSEDVYSIFVSDNLIHVYKADVSDDGGYTLTEMPTAMRFTNAYAKHTSPETPGTPETPGGSESSDTYKVTYVDGLADEDIFAEQSYPNLSLGQQTPPFEGSLERAGHVFAGWTPEVAARVTDDVVYEATWEVDRNGNGVADKDEDHYTVTYTDGVDGVELFADQVTGRLLSGDDTPAFEGTPTREHYTFTGWTPEVAKKVTGSVTYTATWAEEEPTGPGEPEDPTGSGDQGTQAGSGDQGTQAGSGDQGTQAGSSGEGTTPGSGDKSGTAKKKAQGVSGVLLPKVIAKGAHKQKLTWTSLPSADGYDVYFARCIHGKVVPSYHKVASVKASAKRVYVRTGLQKGVKYKYYVVAYRVVRGKKKTVKTSFTVHSIAGNKVNNTANVKSVKGPVSKLSLKAGKSKKIQGAKAVSAVKGMRPLWREHTPEIRYLSSNKKVVKVSASGKVKAKKAGSAKVYLIASNGVRKSVRVTVK